MAISLTEAAARHVTRYLGKRGKGVGVRLGVKTTGCSGLAYKLEYDEWALMSSLSRGQRARLERIARRRLAALTLDDFVWTADVVMAWGQVPTIASPGAASVDRAPGS